MNESNEKDDTDQEEGDEEFFSLSPGLPYFMREEIRKKAREKEEKILKKMREEEEVKEMQQKNKKTIKEIKKKKRELNKTEKGIKNEIGEEEWGKMGEGEKIKKIRDEWNKRQEEEMKKNKAKAEEVKEKKKAEKMKMDAKARRNIERERKKFFGEYEPAEIDLSILEATPTSNNTSSDGGEKVKKEKDSGDAVESTKKSAAKIMNVKGAKTRILDPNLDSEGIHTGKVFPSWQKDSYVISMCDPNVENIPPKPPEISNTQPEGATMKTWDIDEAIKERQK